MSNDEGCPRLVRKQLPATIARERPTPAAVARLPSHAGLPPSEAHVSGSGEAQPHTLICGDVSECCPVRAAPQGAVRPLEGAAAAVLLRIVFNCS